MADIHNPTFKQGSLTEGTHTATTLVKLNGTQEQFLKADGTVSTGAFDKYFEHDQGVSSNTWTIQHDLDKNPAIIVTNSVGTVVVGDIQFIDTNNVIITFNATFSGKAYLN